MHESRARGRACGLLSVPRQGFNRLVHSSTKCINDYHNSSHICHGTHLHFKFKFKFSFISSQFKVTNIQIDIKSINLQSKIDTAICKV